MKPLIALALLSLSSLALADGLKCEQREFALNIKVFNETSASAGVRNAAIMVFSDENVSYGRKTIASFTGEKSTLAQNGTHYVAKVDLRVSESNRSGENILGTKLGQIKEIYVDVDHNYSQPVANGEMLDGTVTIVKRNGSEETFDLTCERYLKN